MCWTEASRDVGRIHLISAFFRLLANPGNEFLFRTRTKEKTSEYCLLLARLLVGYLPQMGVIDSYALQGGVQLVVTFGLGSSFVRIFAGS
jgi:hypothetical protein